MKIAYQVLFTVLHFCISVYSTCSGGPYIVFPSEIFRQLTGSTFMEYYQHGYNECFDKCIRRPACKSFNYRNMDLFCQLNNNAAVEYFELTFKTAYVYTSMEGHRKTIYDPCQYVDGCVPGTVCTRHNDGTKTCDMEDPAVYQTYLDELASATTTTMAVTTTNVIETSETETNETMSNISMMTNTTEADVITTTTSTTTTTRKVG